MMNFLLAATIALAFFAAGIGVIASVVLIGVVLSNLHDGEGW